MVADGGEPPIQGTGLICLTAVARHYGLDVSPEGLIHEYGLEPGEPGLDELVHVANGAGLQAAATTLEWDDLHGMADNFPILLRLKNGNTVVLSAVRKADEGEEAAIFDPLSNRPGFLFLKRETLLGAWAGEAILLKRRYSWKDADQPFGLKWFLPEIIRQRRAFTDVAITAIALHLIGFVVPIFMQITIDKVLLHDSYTTLEVIGIGAVSTILFDAFLGYLRNYLLLHSGAKIDIRVATHTFKHLLSLPISFFEQISAGVLTKHMQQISSLREFLTGRVFMTALDSLALFVFLPVLFFYSWHLAIILLGFALMLCAVVGAVSWLLRRRLEELYKAEGERQGLLVEAIHGMGTIKALAIAPTLRQQWDARSANSIERTFEVGRTAAMGRSISQMIEKLLMVAIIWVGALDVMDKELSVGALVAFNMLAGRVTGPLVQLVGLIQDYQQTSISVRMLGIVMNQRGEGGAANGLRPKLEGRLELDDVTFRYPGSLAPVLDGVSFQIPSGKVVGIVGRSGSGKTTLTKLIQGLHMVESGVIRLDGHDIRTVDLMSLRSQVGVVLQESFLFRGTVRENIAYAKPGAPLAEIVHVAKLAGAHEFIERLPDGYETKLEEGATNLSGGQKQRISIARALIRDPALLILDEATSALDPESEAVVRKNLRLIAGGRTTLIVSHRMAFIADADMILVMDQGRVADLGRHAELLARCEIYRQLWEQQMGPVV
jgi:subfamily B ATP-binding cassette protein HlyB/CyaB